MNRLLIIFFLSQLILFGEIKVTLPVNIHHNVFDTVDIPINISDVTDSNITSINFSITYDSTVIHIFDYINDNTLTDNMFISKNTLSDRITVAVVSATPFLGQGTLGILRVACIGNGKSLLTWEHFLCNSGSPVAITTDGSILVGTVDIDINDNHLVTQNYSLMQNYPNPFNSSTTIIYSLENRNNVNIKIFNMLGNVIIEFVNKQQIPGVYQIKWNSAKLSSGIYFYSIEMRSDEGVINFTKTKSMILLK